jgi:RNA polymerase sigma-70 factor (ECF subfamily)
LRDEKDRGLIEKSLRGDEKAFRRLVEMHTPLVYSAVRAILGGCPDVEDTVQDVFVKVYRGLHAFRGESKLSTWIYRIARNEALNASARVRPDLVTIEEARDIGSKIKGPDKIYRIEKEREMLNRLIQRLDERYRIALELRYMGEKSYAEISEMMEIPEGTVKTYIHRAKAALKKMLAAKNPNKIREERRMQ